MEPAPFYRPRNPRTTPLWKLAETHYERLRLVWEETRGSGLETILCEAWSLPGMLLDYSFEA